MYRESGPDIAGRCPFTHVGPKTSRDLSMSEGVLTYWKFFIWLS